MKDNKKVKQLAKNMNPSEYKAEHDYRDELLLSWKHLGSSITFDALKIGDEIEMRDGVKAVITFARIVNLASEDGDGLVRGIYGIGAWDLLTQLHGINRNDSLNFLHLKLQKVLEL